MSDEFLEYQRQVRDLIEESLAVDPQWFQNPPISGYAAMVDDRLWSNFALAVKETGDI